MKRNKIAEKVEKGVIEFRKTLATLSVASFGFVAALIWKDVIMGFFTEVLHLEWGTDLLETTYAALIVTFLLVFIIWFTSNFINVKQK